MRNQPANIAALRHAVSCLEGRNDHQFMPAQTDVETRLTFGDQQIDGHLSGGLSSDCMHEVRSEYTRDIGAVTAFICAFLARNTVRGGKLVWVVEPAAHVESGQLYPDGLRQFGLDPNDIVFVHPRDMKTAIWATGEAARQGGLAAIVFQVQGNPKILDLTVSRKLMLRAQASKTPLFLLRQGGVEEASSANTRWQVAPLSSQEDQHLKRGIGRMRHRLTLERNRTGQTGTWPVSWQTSERKFSHAATKAPPTHYRTTVPTSHNRPDIPPSLGQVMAFERAS